MAETGQEEVIRISVRDLVGFILREGDIDDRIAGGMEKDAMQQGSRLHRKLQKQMGAAYHAEVPLKICLPRDGFILQIEGRADGIFPDGEEMTVDEIKTVVRSLEYIREPLGVHLAQAKCYAYMYAVQEKLEKISVQMTYCHMETEEIRRFRSSYEVEELREWFEGVASAYEKWARFQIDWKQERNAAIQRTEFPFPYREGQRDLVVSVYRAVLRQKKLFIQAPTGVGKTMAVVFPAVRAVGEGLAERIFYLTAKTIARTVAEQAFRTLRAQGLRYKVITLTAKEKICFCEETKCDPESCPYAKGHYDRVNDAVFELISEEDELTREAVERHAKKHQVCPFEMALDAAMWVDAVICDYNYAFDPNARLKRFFSEGSREKCIFLVDEAHNLVERGREMYSAELYKEDILEVRRLVRQEDKKLAKCLDGCNKQFLQMKKECETFQLQESIAPAALSLLHLSSALEDHLEEHTDPEKRAAVLEFYFRVREFLNIYELLDDNYVIYSELEPGGQFKLKLLCVDPSVNLNSCLEQGQSTVFFSATLLPIHYYKKLLSTEKEDYAVYAESAFPQENRLVLVAGDVNTCYRLRGKEMYRRFARYILRMAEARRGNYLAFFPSYRMMAEIYECFQEEEKADPEMECIVQSQYMGEEAREIFLETFEEDRAHTLVGFCVMGGVFSEGIDLARERLIGAAVIGTGLPQVCNEREIIRNFFDKKEMEGFDFAYRYPGMNKVLQSAGRVIRTEEDKGVVLLLDDRFLESRYQKNFPREWAGWQPCGLEDVSEKLKTFWENADPTR